MDTFESNILSLYGKRGESWLRSLPESVTRIATKYGLSELTAVRHLSYNYVSLGFRGDMPIILKLGLDIGDLKRERAALSAFAKFGAPQIMASEDGMLILERAIPGGSLKAHFPAQELQAINIACSVISKLHAAPIDHSFPHIMDWLSVLDKKLDIPAYYLQKARGLRDDLLLNPMKELLLHGDLHHDNILQNGRDWMAIDPKGVVGEAAFEIASFIHNPIPKLLESKAAKSIIECRIATFARLLALPADRIRAWCFIKAVLSWAWNLEDSLDIGYFKALTEILY